MGLATHLGPWRLGTVRYTTAAVTAANVGQIANIGLTCATQTKQVNYAGVTTAGVTTNIWVLPAGSQIHWINVDVLTALTVATTAPVIIGTAASTALFMASTDLVAAGAARIANISASFNPKLTNFNGATSTAAPDGIGVGPLDVIVQANVTPTGATIGVGIVQFTVMYTVRNADGTGQTILYQNN